MRDEYTIVGAWTVPSALSSAYPAFILSDQDCCWSAPSGWAVAGLAACNAEGTDRIAAERHGSARCARACKQTVHCYLGERLSPCQSSTQQAQGLSCACWTLKQRIVSLRCMQREVNTQHEGRKSQPSSSRCSIQLACCKACITLSMYAS